jgi:pimeloyl-ACP methyl ester carboxylesterase
MCVTGPDRLDRYEAVLAKWPVPRASIQLTGRFGSTRVNVCGAADRPPVVLLPGGRSSSAGWYATVGALAPGSRIYAVDLLGDHGRSVPSGSPIRTRADLTSWLDGVLDELGLRAAALVGHSYGGWIAAQYSIAEPERVSRLVLIDPAETLTATRAGFRLRGIPLVLGRGCDRYRRFYLWETRGWPCDPAFLDLWSYGAGTGAGGVVWPRRPGPGELARLTMPVLVVAAGRSRQNDASALVAAARRLQAAQAVLIAGATHFTVLHDQPERELNPALGAFLAAPAA